MSLILKAFQAISFMVLIGLTTPSSAAQLPSDFHGTFAAQGFPGFCPTTINHNTISGLFEGGGSCQVKSLKRLTLSNDPNAKGYQGNFSCFHEGSEWTTQIEIWQITEANSSGNIALTLIMNSEQSADKQHTSTIMKCR